MTSILSSLLFKAEIAHPAGRLVRFDQKEACINFVTGPMDERILAFLAHEQCPISAREVSAGIQSNISRVTQTLGRLILEKRVSRIKIDGCVTQYTLP